MEDAPAVAIPNLPGMTQHRRGPVARKGGFRMVNGIAIEVDASMSRSASSPGLGASQLVPGYVQQSRRVLKFGGYFKEAVHDSATESYRVRKCNIYYYLEDGSIHIDECKTENSGIPQGTFVKRNLIPKAGGEEGEYITEWDIEIGQPLKIYGRTFMITDCNSSTAAHLEKQGRSAAPIETPEDPGATLRAEQMKRETGMDMSVYRGSKMNPMKKFMEANLGKFTRDPENLRKFLANDRKVLRFFCVWDNTILFGEPQQYTIHFYLTDDTMEVVEQHKHNSGRDPFPKLLARKKLPRNYEEDGRMGNDDTSAEKYYAWTDFRAGQVVNIYGRDVKVLDADPFTKQFFEAEGVDFGTPIELAEEKKEIPRMPIPPHNGIGSEEDSLGSCMSLRPKQPKRDYARLNRLERSIMRFKSRIVSDLVEDEGRKFSISYYLADDTVSIYEPPQKNTGIVGGKFLERGRYKSTTTGEYLAATDFFVGATVKITGFTFVIEGADEFTIRWMEGNKDEFPMADASSVIDVLKMKLQNKGSKITDVFRAMDKDKSNQITIDEMREALDGYGIPPQACIAVMRYFDTDGSGLISMDEFKAAVLDDDMGSEARKRQAKESTDKMGHDEYTAKAEALAGAHKDEKSLAITLKKFGDMFFNKKGQLTQTFRLIDTDGTGAVDKAEFMDALSLSSSRTDLIMSDPEIEMLAGYFFPDGSDELDYNTFLQSIWKIADPQGTRSAGGF